MVCILVPRLYSSASRCYLGENGVLVTKLFQLVAIVAAELVAVKLMGALITVLPPHVELSRFRFFVFF